MRQHHHRGELEAYIEERPAFDCILGLCPVPDCPGPSEGPEHNHGRGSRTDRWIIKGEGLAVQWLVYTDEFLSITLLALVEGRQEWRDLFPMAADIGYHSSEPLYEGHWVQGDCDILGLEKCYYDGSALQASIGLEIQANGGDAAVWLWLEQYYYDILTRKEEASVNE